MRWIALLLLMATAAISAQPPADDTAEPPGMYEPFPFDHDVHARPFKRAGLWCGDCHPIGNVTDLDGAQVELAAPRSVCHGCHAGEVPGAPQRASNRCVTCHSERGALRPESHTMGWERSHGAAVRGVRTECRNCHDTSQCITCHEARGAMVRSPHVIGFRSFHGMEARIDPASCVNCHADETCVACHTEGQWPW